jgi:hypothetical protein
VPFYSITRVVGGWRLVGRTSGRMGCGTCVARYSEIWRSRRSGGVGDEARSGSEGWFLARFQKWRFSAGTPLALHDIEIDV